MCVDDPVPICSEEHQRCVLDEGSLELFTTLRELDYYFSFVEVGLACWYLLQYNPVTHRSRHHTHMWFVAVATMAVATYTHIRTIFWMCTLTVSVVLLSCFPLASLRAARLLREGFPDERWLCSGCALAVRARSRGQAGRVTGQQASPTG
jgi:hypothetical protein